MAVRFVSLGARVAHLLVRPAAAGVGARFDVEGERGDAADPADDREGVVGLVDAADHHAHVGLPEGDGAGVREDHGRELPGCQAEGGAPEYQAGDGDCQHAARGGGGGGEGKELVAQCKEG